MARKRGLNDRLPLSQAAAAAPDRVVFDGSKEPRVPPQYSIHDLKEKLPFPPQFVAQVGRHWLGGGRG